MPFQSAMRTAAAIAALSLAVGPLPAAAAVQPMPAEQAGTRSILVPKDKSVAYRLDRPAGEIVVAQPEMLQLVAVTDRSFYVRGKQPGVTNILVYDRNRRLVEVIDVVVGYDVDAIQADIGAALPGERVAVQNVGGGVLLSGDISTNSARTRALAIAERYAPKAVSSALNVRLSEQVMLEVRVLEAGRSALRELGVDLLIQNNSGFVFESGGGPVPRQGLLNLTTNAGSTSIDVTVQALEEKGVLRTLARPNLVALSGKEATFLAGGEFPYPIPADEGQVALAFRPFGVNLRFTPEVETGGLIRLKVAPEVSQLSPDDGIRINGIVVPGLTTRRVDTTVELRDGESFAIAGLFQQEYANNLSQIPWISEIPVLGALFRSARWRRQETELVVIVTPRMVSPAQSQALSPDPLGAGVEPGLPAMVTLGASHDKRLSAPVKSDPGR
jgi:pilus assembly protein CpaC